jgi:hypothetical protein
MRKLMLLALALAAPGQFYMPGSDAIGSTADFDFGDHQHRWSDATVRNIYHDNFEYVGGEMRILRPIRVVEMWRGAGDTEKINLPNGWVVLCRHKTCVVEKP